MMWENGICYNLCSVYLYLRESERICLQNCTLIVSLFIKTEKMSLHMIQRCLVRVRLRHSNKAIRGLRSVRN